MTTTKPAAHTPKPWMIRCGSTVFPQVGRAVTQLDVVAYCDDPHSSLTSAIGEANAAHIVHCVNAYDSLVAALREQVAKIDAWANTTRPGNTVDVLLNVGQLARAALAQVEAER